MCTLTYHVTLRMHSSINSSDTRNSIRICFFKFKGVAIYKTHVVVIALSCNNKIHVFICSWHKFPGSLVYRLHPIAPQRAREPTFPGVNQAELKMHVEAFETKILYSWMPKFCGEGKMHKRTFRFSCPGDLEPRFENLFLAFQEFRINFPRSIKISAQLTTFTSRNSNCEKRPIVGLSRCWFYFDRRLS